MSLIAITGGIGSGKSVVSNILRAMCRPVYDCDSEAKRLMTDDAELRAALKGAFGEETYDKFGRLNRYYLASRVFGNSDALTTVNCLVHPAVKRDVERWATQQATNDAWVETALLLESGMDGMVDEAWLVEAPIETRVERVIARDGSDREQVLQRISRQTLPDDESCSCPLRRIVNDGRRALLPQIFRLLQGR